MRLKNKVVPIDAVEEGGNWCHVKILDLFLKKIPPEAFSKNNFYLQPVCKVMPILVLLYSCWT